MTVTLDLSPEVREKLLAQARERGISLHDYVQEIVAREAHLATVLPSIQETNLSDLLLKSPFAGANLNLERNQDLPRQIDLE
jgi:hypothetical protein